MDILFNVEAVTSQHNLKGLRHIYDLVEFHVQSVKSLGVSPNSYGTLLSSVLLNKLPLEMWLITSRSCMWDCEAGGGQTSHPPKKWMLDSTLKPQPTLQLLRQPLPGSEVTEPSYCKQPRLLHSIPVTHECLSWCELCWTPAASDRTLLTVWRRSCHLFPRVSSVCR